MYLPHLGMAVLLDALAVRHASSPVPEEGRPEKSDPAGGAPLDFGIRGERRGVSPPVLPAVPAGSRRAARQNREGTPLPGPPPGAAQRPGEGAPFRPGGNSA